jgi:anti-sigma factor RsiW
MRSRSLQLCPLFIRVLLCVVYGFTPPPGDNVDGRAVAALIYQRRKHTVNVFVEPARGATRAAIDATSRRGFHVRHWARDGMAFWAASDLADPELSEFAGALLSAGRQN